MESSTQQTSSTVYETVKQTIIYNITKKLLNTLQTNSHAKYTINKNIIDNLCKRSNFDKIAKLYNIFAIINSNDYNTINFLDNLFELIKSLTIYLNTFDYCELILLEYMLDDPNNILKIKN